jgi:hypothetical protein
VESFPAPQTAATVMKMTKMMNPVPQQKAIKNGGFEVWHDGA